jgi:hypothetical protein
LNLSQCVPVPAIKFVPHDRDDERDGHPDHRDAAPHVVHQEFLPENRRGGPRQQEKIADGEDDPQFRRAEQTVRHVEFPKRVSRQVRIDHQQVVKREQPAGHALADESRHGHSAEERKRAEGVHDVIDVKAVAGPGFLSKPGEVSVEAVAEPVDEQHEVDRVQPQAVMGSGQPVEKTGGDEGEKAQDGEVIGIDSGGNPSDEPRERAAFERSDQSGKFSFGVFEGDCRSHGIRPSGEQFLSLSPPGCATSPKS